MTPITDRQTVNSLATKFAAGILLKHKEISVADIRALPFVETDEEAMLIAKHLSQIFEVEIGQVKSASIVPEWIDVLRLKPHPAV